jgi:sugar phosphate isomerase/epimerase
MRHGISTHVFLQQRLSPALLDALLAGGAAAIEVFAARHHFNYTDRAAVQELANWFRSHDVAATMHMPLFTADDERLWSRHTAATLNLIHLNKADRIDTMDEVKRALEAAELVPFQSCVIHLGLKDDAWDTRALDDSLTAIEHLKAFAGPLGIQLLLENLPNDVATPDHLVEIVRVGHFANVGFCLDLGHANLVSATPETAESPAKSGIDLAFAAFGDRIAELHIHDNHGPFAGGGKDEHLWPGEGDIDWPATAHHIAALKTPPLGVLEIAHELGEEPATVSESAKRTWELFSA